MAAKTLDELMEEWRRQRAVAAAAQSLGVEETEPESGGFWASQGKKLTEQIAKPGGLESQTPVTTENLAKIGAGLKASVVKEINKPAGEIMSDIASAPLAILRTGVGSFLNSARTIYEDPIEGIPIAAELLAGGAAMFGGATAPWALPIAAGARVAGEAAVGLIKGKNPNTIENWSQVLFGPARFAMGTAVAGGAIKGALREAVETGTKTGLAGKVAKFLDLNELSLPKHKLADVTVKPLEDLMTPPERALARLADTLNRDDQLKERNQYFNLKPTKQLRQEAEIIDAADQVLTRDPADYVGERAKDIAAEVRKEVDKRGRQQQYLINMGELHDLEDHATLQGGVLPLHLLPVGPEQRAKALADPDYHKQLTGEVLNDLRNDTYPEGNLGIMEKKYGPLNVAQAKASWKIQQDLDAEMGRRIPAYTQDPETGKLTPINLTGDEVTDAVQRALRAIPPGEYRLGPKGQAPASLSPDFRPWEMTKREFDESVLYSGTVHPTVTTQYGTDLPNMAAKFAEEAQAIGGPEVGRADQGIVRVRPRVGAREMTTNEYEIPTTATVLTELSPGEARAGAHKALVVRAIKEGQVVPPHVLAEYPELLSTLQKAQKAMTAVQRGEYDKTQLVETPLTEAEAATLTGITGPDVLPRLTKALETVPNEKLNALRAEMRRNREADRATRLGRRVDPAMADEELDNILKAHQTFIDEQTDAARLGSAATTLAQKGAQVRGQLTDVAQRDARTSLLEYLKESHSKLWDKAADTKTNYEAEVLKATPASMGPLLQSRFMDLRDDMRELRQGSHHVPNDPMVEGQTAVKKALGYFGIAPWAWDPQHMLSKNGNPFLTWIGSLANKADYVSGNAEYAFQQAAAQMFTKHGVDSSWNDYLIVGQQHKEWLEEGMKRIQQGLTPQAKENIVRELFEKGVASARDPKRVDPTVPLATMPKFAEEDVAQWAKTLDFGQDLMANVRTPLFAFAKEMNMSPERLAVYQRNLLFPTSVAETELDALTDGIAQLQTRMTAMAAKGDTVETSAAMSRAAEVLENLNRRKVMATESVGKIGEAISEASALYDEHGIAKARVYDPSMFAKHTDLVFGNDPYKTYLGHISGTVRKAVYDQVLPNIDANLAKFMETQGTNDKTRAIQRWVNDFTLDQVGQRKNHEYDKIATTLNRGGLPISAQTLKKSVGAVNTLRYVLDIAMNARFYPLQMTQNALFLMPLVGEESFTHGLGKFLPSQWKAAAEEAIAVGAVAGDIPKFFTEDVPERMLAAAEKAGTLVQFTEKMNRVQAYHAGKHNALQNGLSEQQAIRHGLQVVRDTNFFMTNSNRATATNTPTGSALMRYRSFSNTYATFLAGHIRKGNWDVVGSSIGVLLSMSGTAGIPLYGLVQWSLAQQGINLPSIDPVEYTTGASIGGAGSALPGLPTSMRGLSPVTAPFAAFAENPTFKEGAVAAARALAGGPTVRIASAVAELMRGGVTRTPSGQVKTRRTTGRILQSAGGFAPTAENEYRAGRAELQRALSAGDRAALPAMRQRKSDLGAWLNWRELQSQAKSSISRQKNRSALSMFLGS